MKANLSRAITPAARFSLRQERDELLDLGQGDARDVASNLAEMERINFYLGGYRALTRHLFPRLAALGRPGTVLDIGTGAAGLPYLIARWACRHGVKVRVMAVDRVGHHLAVACSRTARNDEVVLLQADALRLPFSRSGIEYTVSSLVLHHFAPETLSEMLARAWEASSCGLIMSDLVRGWLPYFAFKLAQPVFARNYLTRHDGAVSILRAYRPQELLAVAHAAGLRGARVYTHFPWRMTLVVDR